MTWKIEPGMFVFLVPLHPCLALRTPHIIFHPSWFLQSRLRPFFPSLHFVKCTLLVFLLHIASQPRPVSQSVSANIFAVFPAHVKKIITHQEKDRKSYSFRLTLCETHVEWLVQFAWNDGPPTPSAKSFTAISLVTILTPARSFHWFFS